jgi:hypothetical protein
MQHSLKILQLTALATLISACGGIVGPTAQEATLQARNNDLGTQIADLRQTATVEMDRMMVTVEHSETEVRSVAFQRDALRATLIARGTDAGFVDVTIPQDGAGLPPGIDTGSLLLTPAPGAAAPPVTPPGAGDPNASGVGDPAAVLDPNQVEQGTPTAVAPTTGARLVDPVLATGVLNNDCAANNFTTFDSTTEAIYVVATAVDFPVGTTVTASWSREGTVQGSYDIPFDFAIQQACVWAFIDQSDFPFTPGNWTVEILVNGQPSVGPVAFTITGEAPAAAEAPTDDIAGGQ